LVLTFANEPAATEYKEPDASIPILCSPPAEWCDGNWPYGRAKEVGAHNQHRREKP